MSLIDHAIADEVVIQFLYEKADGPMLRVVSPYEVADDGSTWLGWDHARDGLRRFAFDKIIGEAEPIDEDYVRPVAVA